jgi:dTDP-4-dehydrorhamnose 3,5-epimerase
LLPGVKVRTLQKHPDERGFFLELARKDWGEFASDRILQVNLSLIHPGVVKAWHRHSRGQVDYITAISGEAVVCAYDAGKRAKTRGQLAEYFLSEDKPQVVRVPGKYWHGVKAVGKNDALILYLHNRLYSYKNPDEERLPWNDPSIVDPRTGKTYDWNRTKVR